LQSFWRGDKTWLNPEWSKSMPTRIKTGPGLALMVGFAMSTQAASAALRCGTELILEGDTKQALLDACGEPDEGSSAMHTDVWIYRIDGEEYRVHLLNETVERIDAPEMSKEAPPPDSPGESPQR